MVGADMSAAPYQFMQVALFSIPLTLSPGPNNLMVTSNCAQYGYARTLPALAGISMGATAMFLAMSLGLGLALLSHPQLHETMKWIGSGYILYLSFKLYTSKAEGPKDTTCGRPITFFQALLLQIANPKIWLLAATAASSFLPLSHNLYRDAAVLSMTLGGIFFPCNSIWAIFGLVLRRFLNGKTSWRRFNRTMGVVTASSTLFLI